MGFGTFVANGRDVSGAQGVAFPRIPMTLTSRLRRAAVAGAALLREGDANIGRTRTEALAFFGNANAFMPTIAMAVNPNSIQFDQPKRWTKKDTMEGSVFFHFTNAKGQNNDILTIRFAGNTGNIDLRGSLGSSRPPTEREAQGASATTGPDTGALYKLLVWHNLYLLTREPMLLADGSDNVVTIAFRSALFPVQMSVDGFFTKVLEFEEAANKPHSRNYSFEFTVQEAEPDLDTVLQLLTGTLGAPPTTPVFTNPTDGALFINREPGDLLPDANRETLG